ncbi:hypothetical protein QR680_008564 [Steinernema hermaphroditum]|uniref:Ig-like domain-containing protein n=1 Tax=Steinernema hermaphroditum TaxID=289476 RepID=A0AA39M898_9BILA|nr:hypothetical protein QR680_008564 [Steinernema hermaphroditum]
MCLRHLLALSLLLCGVSAAPSNLRAEGSLAFNVPVESGVSPNDNPLRSTEELTLWCQVRDRHTNQVLKIDSAYFTRKVNGNSHFEADATLSEDLKNATLPLQKLEVTKAGLYTCHITVEGHNVTGNIEVFARPVLHFSGYPVRYDARKEDNFHFDASENAVPDGTEEHVYSCPVFGYPTPVISWTFNNGALPQNTTVSEDGEKLTIRNIGKEHEGVYTCTASNEFVVKNEKKVNTLVVDRPLRVKHWLSFLVPLAAIVLILILLAIVISLCECRRKKNEQQLLEPVTDE